MGRPNKPPHEIVRTAGISLTEAEQERIAQCAAHWDTSKSAAGRSLFLLGLAMFDLLHDLGITLPLLPQQIATALQHLPRPKNTLPAEPVSRHAQRNQETLTARDPATQTGPNWKLPLIPSEDDTIAGRAVDTLIDLYQQMALYEREAATGNTQSAEHAKNLRAIIADLEERDRNAASTSSGNDIQAASNLRTQPPTRH